MAGLGLFAAAGHGLLIVAHKFAPAPVLAPFSYTQLIWMIVSGLIVFGDWPPAATLAGATLVAACGGYVALRERTGTSAFRPSRRDAPPLLLKGRHEQR
jgi:drug/metabolite transporter (DMT)-like permease